MRIPHAKPSLTEQDYEAVQQALRQGHLARGEIIEKFEQALTEYCGAQHAVLFNSGSTALQAAIFAAEIGPGDRVLSTPNSFAATAACVELSGAALRFVEIDKESGNLDVDQLIEEIARVEGGGKLGILPVHYAGIPLQMERVYDALKRADTVVIEDAAAALGARYRSGERVGSCRYSDMTILSFHPEKSITTGEGGCVMTNSEELAVRLRRWRNNGIGDSEDRWLRRVHFWSGNFWMSGLSAALGLAQIERIEEICQRKRERVALYAKLFVEVKGAKPLPGLLEEGVAPNLMVVLIHAQRKRKVMELLAKEGIGTQVHYYPLYRQPPIYAKEEGIDLCFPRMEWFYQRALSLPLYADMEEEHVEQVVEAVKKCLA